MVRKRPVTTSSVALVLLLAGATSVGYVAGIVPVDAAPAPGATYTVRPGDSLYAIGSREDVMWQDLALWNNIPAPYILTVGQVLQLTNAPVVPVTPTAPPAPTPQTYTVVAGDSLHFIGSKTGVAWQTIASINNIVSPWSVDVGQILRLTTAAIVPSPSPSGPCSAGYVRLTFDDGPTSDVTPQILAILKAKDVKATFFVLGSQATYFPNLVRQTVADGHAVANHTWTHARLTTLTAEQARSELTRTSDYLQQLTGRRPTEFRPPHRDTNASIVSLASSLGMAQVLWSVDPEDWRFPGATTLVNSIVPLARDGSIILLHDANSSSAIGLGAVIDGLRAKGLCMR